MHDKYILDNLLNDTSVEEIMINATDEIWISKKGSLLKTDIIQTKNQIEIFAKGLLKEVGIEFSHDRPIYDIKTKKGHRVHIILPPIAIKETTINIRKFYHF
jgi:pilus assembly protein CpaF